MMDDDLHVPILSHQDEKNEINGDEKEVKMMADLRTLLVLICLTVADGVLVVILFDKYTDRYSQYLNQGTAGVYCIVSTTIILGRMFLGDKKPDFGNTRNWVLISIGLLNGTANFFMATSQAHTPGITQSLLYQLTIPLVLALSWLFVGKLCSKIAIAGASLIILGTLVSALRPGGFDGDCGTNKCYTISSVLFAVAQIFLAGERVFEEHTFERYKTDVIYMFCWTLWTQFLLGFALYPAQTVEPFGDLVLDEIPRVILDGIRCNFGSGPSEGYVEDGPSCGFFSLFIFFAYCTVDFACYAYGLFVIQNGGANLMVICSAVALPIQQLILCLPFLGVYTESFFWGDAIALVCVLTGFLVYQVLSPEGTLNEVWKNYYYRRHRGDGVLLDVAE